MTLDELRQIVLAYPETQEDTPFGPGALVYKVRGKMFALIGESQPLAINLKCNPILATMLRETYPAVTPGYHMNKQHWNTVRVDEVPEAELHEWITHSYDLVVKGLPKRDREALGRV